MIQQFNITQKFDLINEHWVPKIVAELNGQYIKLAKIKDELIWHKHDNEDEMFLVVKGTLIMNFKDSTSITQPGEVLIVPKGTEHLPATNGEEVWIMLMEPMSTKHTGEIVHERTINDLEWI